MLQEQEQPEQEQPQEPQECSKSGWELPGAATGATGVPALQEQPGASRSRSHRSAPGLVRLFANTSHTSHTKPHEPHKQRVLSRSRSPRWTPRRPFTCAEPVGRGPATAHERSLRLAVARPSRRSTRSTKTKECNHTSAGAAPGGLGRT